MKEILLVEDSPALMASRARTLEAEGYHVTATSSAKEASKAMKYNSYDLAVIDAGIPEVIEAMSAVTPILIMVEEEKIGSIARTLSMGVWTFLIKPFTAGQLKRAVGEAIGRSNNIKNAIQQRILLPLNNTGKLLVSEAEMGRFFKHILEMIAAETEADRVSVLIVDDKTSQLEVRAELGPQPGGISGDEKLGQWVIKTSQPLMVNDLTDANSYIKEIMTDLGAASLLSVPLLTGERAVGVINAIKTVRGTRFTAINLEFLSILAKQAAITTENTYLFKSVAKQRQELEMLLNKAIQSQENERKRVAVEIHDGIGQQIIAALYRVQAFAFLLSQSKLIDARIEADEIRRLLEGTVKELRRVLAGLRPNSLDELGLVSVLREEAERFSQETNTVCRFNTQGSSLRLTSGQEAAIYRVAQEALANIRKHAHATEASIEIRFKSGEVSVVVSDNGKGFQLDQANSSVPIGHMGLLGMKERAEMLGGNLSIISKPGNGTMVVLTIPIKS